MLRTREIWQLTLLFGSGMVFALRPEFGIIAIFIVFALDYSHEKSKRFPVFRVNQLFFFAGLLAFLRIFLGLQNSSLIQGIVEGIGVFVMLILGLYFRKQDYKIFAYGLIIGIITLIGIVVLPRLNSFFDQILYWQDDSTNAVRIQDAEVSKFRAVRKDISWVINNFSVRGAGVVEYQFEIRAAKAFRIGIFFIHAGLTGGRYDQFCEVGIEWRRCSLKVNLEKRSLATVGVGGSTWTLDSPILEIKNPRIIDGVQPNLIDVLTDPTRVKGFAFNENAFGAHVTLIGLLIAIFLPMPWGFMVGILTIATILLSGSRGASIAFFVSGLVWLVGKSRWSRFLPLVLMAFLLGVAGLQLRALTGISPVAVQSTRSLSFDNSSARIRLEIWRLATKAWLENPRTFLIGTGDLTNAMKAKFDARSSSFGLTKDSLTHAHNLWIQTAGESGLLGLCAMLWLWGWVILRAWRSRDAGALALLAAIFVINSVDYLFFYAPVHLAFWMAAAGLKRTEPTPVPPEGSAILTP